MVTGREVDVAVLRRADGSLMVPPALEIVAEGVFDYEAKYGGHADFRVPAELDEPERKALEDAAVATYDALGLRRRRTGRLLPDRGRAGAQRGEHHPRA